jgi:hypothetical protein
MEQTKLVQIQMAEMKESRHWKPMFEEVKLLGERLGVEIRVLAGDQESL